MEAELKNCPFCGSKADYDPVEGIHVSCTNLDCLAYDFGRFVTSNEWNSRHSDQELIHKAAWEIVKRMDDITPKYWRPELAKDKPGTYCSEMRQMIRKVLTDLGN